MSRDRPPRSVIREIYERDNYTCQNCGRKDKPENDTRIEAHHVVALEDGGTNKKSNMKSLCVDCHNAVTYDSHKAPTKIRKEKIGNLEWTIEETHEQQPDPENNNSTSETVKEEKESGDTKPDNNTQSEIETLAYSIKQFFVSIRNIEITSEVSPTLETCPICGKASTELPRFIPPDTVDCEECGARFKTGKFGLSNQMTVVKGASDQMGETRTTEEWKNIAQSKSESDAKTNLLATPEEHTEG